jgi:hypothetical protein
MKEVLLEEYCEFNYEPEIVESAVDGRKRVILKGTFQEADAPNGNGRIYPFSILDRELKRLDRFIVERKMVGEMDHPPGRVKPLLSEASHVITKLEMRGKKMYGELEILPTSRGKDLLALYESGIKLGVSSRGTGGLKPAGNGLLVVEDNYRLNTFDVVGEPSVGDAYINEALELNSRFLRTGNALSIINRGIYDVFGKKL